MNWRAIRRIVEKGFRNLLEGGLAKRGGEGDMRRMNPPWHRNATTTKILHKGLLFLLGTRFDRQFLFGSDSLVFTRR